MRINKGSTVAQAAKQIGITEQTYYSWRKEFSGLNTSQVIKHQDLEKENTGLKKRVADLSLGNAILEDIAEEGGHCGREQCPSSVRDWWFKRIN